MKKLPLLYYLVPLALIAAVFFVLKAATKPLFTINTSQTAVVTQMQQLSRLETASFTIEKIVDAGTTGNSLQQFLFGDKLLLIAHGEVIAGFDLANMNKNDVDISGKTLTMHLPAPQILSSRLDNEKTTVYDRKTGLLTKGNPNLESQARLAAEQSIRQAACDAGILDQATTNAQKQLKVLFNTNFSTVNIIVPPGHCS